MLVVGGANLSTISIHAPLRERRAKASGFKSCRKISIHAPLRERHHGFCLNFNDEVFQSTLPYGSDVGLQEVEIVGLEFQSTLPYGSDD